MKKILLCEDNDITAEMITAVVTDAGHAIVRVEDGRKAVAAALVEKPDLVLMDLRMPEVDGITAARTLRAKGYTGPMVMMTASADPEDRERATEAGCNAFITKGAGMTDLVGTLERLLGQ